MFIGFSQNRIAVPTKKGWSQIRQAKRFRPRYLKRERPWTESDLDSVLEIVVQIPAPREFVSNKLSSEKTDLLVYDDAAWLKILETQDKYLIEKRQEEIRVRELNLKEKHDAKYRAYVLRSIRPPTNVMSVRDMAISQRYCPLPPWRAYQMIARKRRAEWMRQQQKRRQRFLRKVSARVLMDAQRQLDIQKALTAFKYAVKEPVAKGVVYATSQKRVTKKWSKIEEDLTRLVDAHVPQQPKLRDEFLLIRLQYIIRRLAANRLKRQARKAYEERQLLKMMEVLEVVDPQIGDDEVVPSTSEDDILVDISAENQEAISQSLDILSAPIIHDVVDRVDKHVLEHKNNSIAMNALCKNVKEKLSILEGLDDKDDKLEKFTKKALEDYSKFSVNPKDNSVAILTLQSEVAMVMSEYLTDSLTKPKKKSESEAQPQGGVVTKVKNTANNLDSAVNEFRDTNGKVNNLATKAKDMWSQLQSKLGKFGEHFTFDRLTLILSQVGHMMINPAVSTIALAVGTIIVCVVGASFEYIMETASSICNWIKDLFSKKQTKSQVEPQSDGDSTTELLATLFSLVAGVACFKFNKDAGFLNMLRRTFWDFSIVGRGVQGVVVILKHLFGVVSKMWEWIKLKLCYGGDISHKLINSPQKVQRWAKLAEKLLHPNTEKQYGDFPDYVDHIERYYLIGVNYHTIVAQSKKELSCKQYIGKLTERLRVKRDELVNRGMFPFARVVPFSVNMVSEDPGIGKSTMINKAIYSMLGSQKIKCRSPYYKIELMNDHWDTCQNEPAIVIDDAWNIRESTTEVKQIAAYYNLVTDTPFTPPMAALENKKLRINPVILWVNSNVAYPKLNTMEKYTALWRRRDVLIEAYVHQDHRKNYKNGKIDIDAYTEEEKRQFIWLRFKVRDNPVDPESSYSYVDSTYDQIMTVINEKFAAHMKNQIYLLNDKMRIRVEAFKNIDGEKTVDQMLDDMYEDIKKKAKDNAKKDSMETKLWDINLSNIDFADAETDDSYKAEMEYVVKESIKNSTDRTNLDRRFEEIAKKNNLSIVGSRKFLREEHKDKIDYNLVKKAFLGNCSEWDLPAVAQLIANWPRFGRCKHYVCPCVEIVQCSTTYYVMYSCNRRGCIERIYKYECDENCELNKFVTLNMPDSMFNINAEKLRMLEETIKENYLNLSLKVAKRKAKSKLSMVCRALGKTIKWISIIVLPLIVSSLGFLMIKEIGAGLSPFDAFKKVATGKAGLPFCMDSFQMGVAAAQGTSYESATNTKGQGRVAVRNLVAPRVEPNSQEDEVVKLLAPANKQYIDDCIRILGNNTFTLVAEYLSVGTVSRVTARGVFVRGNQFLTVRHGWDEVSDRVKMRNGTLRLVKVPDYIQEIDIDKVVVESFKSSNFVLLTLPGVAAKKDIIGMFATMRSHDRTTLRGLIMEVKDVTKITNVKINWNMKPVIVDATPNSVYVPLTSSYEYNYGGKGVCGSLLICPDVNPCVVGMHVAGLNTTVGYSEPIFQEMFREIKNNNPIKDIVLPDVKDFNDSRYTLEGSFLTLGAVEAQFSHNESGVSSIVPSAVHGIFPVATEPAPLSNHDPRLPPGTSPMLEGVKKHGKPIKGFPKELIEFGSDSLKKIMRVDVKPVIPLQPVSLQDAICGRPGIQGFSSLNFSSSEGFPLSASRPPGAVSKKYLFDLELTPEGYFCNGIDDKLKSILSIKQRLREKAIVPFTVFTDCLKDARIAKEKCIVPGKTRIFSTSPVDFSIQCRQYFLPYTIAHQNSRNWFTSAVGINVNGAEWSVLVNNMKNFSDFQLCGDYSNFGPGFDQEVHRCVGDAIIDWFEFHGDTSITNKTIRQVMVHELAYPWHLCFDLLYQTISGMPSGSPITVETNDLVNLMYVLMAWYEIMKPHKLQSLHHFLKYVKVKTYGDDIWMSVHDRVIEYFNNVAVSEFFAKYGVVYTDADKTGEIIPFKKIDNVSFLKRTPVPHPTRAGYYLAALEKKYCLDIANWCWKSKDINAATLVNLEACSDALYGHGPEVHTKYRHILEMEANKLGLVGNFRSWKELDDIFLEPQSDAYEKVEGDTEGAKDSRNGVTIFEHRGEDVEMGPVTVGKSWNELTCSMNIEKETCGLEQRWLPIKHLQWSTADEVGKVLYEAILPYEGVFKNMSTPMAMRFKQKRFVRCDMSVKVLVNANRFMNGQLYVVWYYGSSYDDTSKYRRTRQSLSQKLHSRIQAGTSNYVTLEIPYMHYYPYLSTVKRTYDDSLLDLGKLEIVVFNQLGTSSASTKQADVQVLLSLTNVTFCGTVDMSLGMQPQMDVFAGLAVTAAEAYLSQYIPDRNRDMPPVPMVANPVSIVGGGNLSYGSAVTEPVHTMRLIPTGQTPFAGLNRASMSVKDVIRIFGFCKTFRWGNDDTGKCLFTVPAGPIWNLKDMDSVKYGDHTYYPLPPVSFIANLYKDWRGPIEVRFDFIANDYYNAACAVVFIPGVQEAPTWEVAKCCDYTVFDLREEKTFTYIMPYVTDRIWWPRPLGLDQRNRYEYPGVMCVYVVNRLTPMDSIPSSIDVNVSIRAGVDFELSVPVQPAISTVLFPQYTTKSAGNIKMDQYPYYLGTSRYFNANKYGVLRYGGYDRVVTCQDTGTNCYYCYTGNDMPNFQEKSGSTWIEGSKPIKWAITYLNPDDSIYWLVPVLSEEDCKDICRMRKMKKDFSQYLVEQPNNDLGKYFGNNNEEWKRYTWSPSTDEKFQIMI